MMSFSTLSFLLDFFPDNDFWFPMNSSASGPIPPCARGPSATYDPDSKSVYVYGGLREGQRYNEMYILDTLTWKWKLVTVGLLQVTNMLEFSIAYQILKQSYRKCPPPPLGERGCSKCGISFCSLL